MQSKFEDLSWLPRTGKNDAAAQSIASPEDAQIRYYIPKEDPLNAGSDGGWGKIDTYGNFIPTDKSSYKVRGGSLVSEIGSIKKRAKFGDWDFVYEDSAHTKQAGWGHCLTSGEILVDRFLFDKELVKEIRNIPSDWYVQNLFEVEDFGEHFVLIKLTLPKVTDFVSLKSETATSRQWDLSEVKL